MSCPCDKLTITCDLSGKGTARIARNVRLTCPQCGAVWDVQRVGSRNELLMAAKPLAARKQKQKPKQPDAEQQKREATFKRLGEEWGQPIPESIGVDLVAAMTSIKPGMRLLFAGSDVGFLQHAAKESTGAGPHAAVADDQWPAYGELFDGIVAAGVINEPERLQSYLKPGGDCWLIGDAQRLAPELSQAWGYQARTVSKGTPAAHLLFVGVDRPLGDGPGTELHHDLASRGMPACQTCRRLAHDMNAWGVEGCRERFDDIVADILPRARNWWKHADNRQKLSAWWKGDHRLWSAFTTGAALATQDLDDVLRTIIGQRVTAAIEEADQRS
jgi:hypothetical protein